MIVRVGPNGAKGDFGYLIAQASSLRFLYSADAATDIGPLTSQTGASRTINFQVGVQAGGPRFRKNSVPINW